MKKDKIDWNYYETNNGLMGKTTMNKRNIKKFLIKGIKIIKWTKNPKDKNKYGLFPNWK